MQEGGGERERGGGEGREGDLEADDAAMPVKELLVFWTLCPGAPGGIRVPVDHPRENVLGGLVLLPRWRVGLGDLEDLEGRAV